MYEGSVSFNLLTSIIRSTVVYLSCSLLWLSFYCPYLFPYDPIRQLTKVTTSESIRNISKLQEDAASWNYESQSYCSYCHLHYVRSGLFENFRHDFKPWKNEEIWRKNVREISEIMLLFQTICVYQWFHRIRLYFLNSTENRKPRTNDRKLLHRYLVRGCLLYSPFTQNPLL